MATELKVTACRRAILNADLNQIDVLTTDRHIPRKEQAALARKLFRSLGIHGISVTAPRYSMASSVDIDLPVDDDGFTGHTTEQRAAIRAKLDAILAKAFPNHNDRSDSQSDYFDFCWTIQGV